MFTSVRFCISQSVSKKVGVCQIRQQDRFIQCEWMEANRTRYFGTRYFGTRYSVGCCCRTVTRAAKSNGAYVGDVFYVSCVGDDILHAWCIYPFHVYQVSLSQGIVLLLRYALQPAASCIGIPLNIHNITKIHFYIVWRWCIPNRKARHIIYCII